MSKYAGIQLYMYALKMALVKSLILDLGNIIYNI